MSKSLGFNVFSTLEYHIILKWIILNLLGWCSIPYTEKQSWQSQSLISHGSATAPRSSDQNDLDKMINYFARDWKNIQKDLQSDSSNEKPNNVIRPTYDNFFDEEFDIDIEFEQYERIEIPGTIRHIFYFSSFYIVF